MIALKLEDAYEPRVFTDKTAEAHRVRERVGGLDESERTEEPAMVGMLTEGCC